MSELRVRMNAVIEAELESVEIFDPASLDRAPRPFQGMPAVLMDPLDGDITDTTVLYGQEVPRAPWEFMP